MEEQAKFFAKVLEYPDGSYDIVAANRPIFGPKVKRSNKTDRTAEPEGEQLAIDEAQAEEKEPKAADLERARSRARANVRRLALANDFRWFVTLTLDKSKIDRYDVDLVVRRLSQWCSNQVRRHGLAYVLVPELHKDGAVHFHGFFNDALEAVASGHADSQGHQVYNLPQWTYGFTTAIELYGDRHAAVGYTCKYIGKDSRKIGGRWYYSGGKLEKPVEKFVGISYGELMEMQDEEFTAQYGQGWQKGTPGGIFAGVNGLR